MPENIPLMKQDRDNAFRAGYVDGKAGRPMACNWHAGGPLNHSYGMGYFHGRAHSR